MNLPIYVRWELKDGTQGYLREGGKNYNLDVMFDSQKHKWKSFVNSNYATDENNNPIESDTIDQAKRVAELHVQKLLIEEGIFHKDGYPLIDERGNPVNRNKK